MNRKHFIETLSLPLAAACVACLTACSKTGAQILEENNKITLNLEEEIKNIDDHLVRNQVIVVRRAEENLPQSFIAFQSNCTHAGGELQWKANPQRFQCPVHGSEFTDHGQPVNGPAVIALRKFNCSVAGKILTVST